MAGCRMENAGAVVVGGDYQGLGIARSLGRHNVPICIIDDEQSIARFSKYTTRSVRVPSLREESETVEALLDTGRRLNLQGWVLYPTRDETVAAISRHRKELAQIYRVPTPDWKAIQWAWDKRNTYQLAEQLGIPAPRRWYISSVEDLADIDVVFPVAIKPAIKEHFFYATKAKAWRANNLAELKELFGQAAQHVGAAEVIVQELIPGDGQQQFSYCAFYKQDRPIASMVVRRARQHPVEFGRASTFVKTTEIPLLEEMSMRFLKAIDYYGLVEMEYKFDARDGLYKLLDVNARTWGYHSLGCAAGVDFPYLLYADQLEMPVQVARGKPDISWIRVVTDLPTSLHEMVARRLRWKDYIDSMWNADAEAVFSRDDLLPGIVEVLLLPYLSIRKGF